MFLRVLVGIGRKNLDSITTQRGVLLQNSHFYIYLTVDLKIFFIIWIIDEKFRSENKTDSIKCMGFDFSMFFSDANENFAGLTKKNIF